MAIQATKKITPYWYTPRSEADAQTKTRFHLKPLTGVDRCDADVHRGADGSWRTTASSARAVLRAGLIGWENFNDESGPVHFNKADPDNNIELLPHSLVSELFVELLNSSIVSEEQEKN